MILGAGKGLSRGALHQASAVAAGVAALIAAIVHPATGQSDGDILGPTTRNPLNPVSAGHFLVADPANVKAEEAEAVYRSLADEMARRYALSGQSIAAAYQGWRRYNTAPYKSVTHGHRYLNNYANAAASDYGRYEDADVMPAGAVVAKDSFSIDNSGEVLPGPLFLMEKMAPGFEPESGDWRYTLILPDGSTLGTTKGAGADNVAFCATCHADASGSEDHLFFLPKAYRVGAAKTDG